MKQTYFFNTSDPFHAYCSFSLIMAAASFVQGGFSAGGNSYPGFNAKDSAAGASFTAACFMLGATATFLSAFSFAYMIRHAINTRKAEEEIQDDIEGQNSINPLYFNTKSSCSFMNFGWITLGVFFALDLYLTFNVLAGEISGDSNNPSDSATINTLKFMMIPAAIMTVSLFTVLSTLHCKANDSIRGICMNSVFPPNDENKSSSDEENTHLTEQLSQSDYNTL